MGSSSFRNLISLSPIAVMLVVYLAGALLAGDFYKIPISVAFIVAAVYGAFLLKGRSVKERDPYSHKEQPTTT